MLDRYRGSIPRLVTEGRMANTLMRRSTLLRDLARYLERQADDFRDAGLPEWAGHLQEDAVLMAGRADVLIQDEPPLPSIESMIGILPSTSEGEHRNGDELRKAANCYFDILERQQVAAFGDDARELIAMMEQSTEGTRELADARDAVYEALRRTDG